MNKTMRGLTVSILWLLLIVMPLAASSAVPQTINYQGYLTDPSGNAVSGSGDITFAIYDVETNGIVLWTETQTVTIYNGVYSVVLGTVDMSGNPLDLPFDAQYWLGVTVGTDSEMTPRQKFAAVPYAYRAVIADSVADNAVTSSNISADAVTAGKIASGAVTSGKIADEAVGSNEIIDGSVTAADLAPGVVPDGHSLDAADGSPVDAVFVDNDGKVGIGTTGPTTELEVAGTVTASAFVGDGSGLTGTSPWLQVNGSDYMTNWIQKDSNRNWYDVAMSADGTVQSAVVYDGQIYVSTDSGNTWTPKESNRGWESVAMSADGTVQTAVTWYDQIYVSTDSGNTWAPKDSNRTWLSVAMSADGTIQTAVAYDYLGAGGQIYVSTDSGNTWVPKESNRTWKSVAMSADGTVQTAVALSDQIYVSTDSGNTWIPKESNRKWRSVAMSADGSKQIAVVYDGQIYVSTDSGNTWIPKESNRGWESVAMSADGTVLTATALSDRIYISSDSGNTWAPTESNRSWKSVAMSADGTVQTAVDSGGLIYVLSAPVFTASYTPSRIGIGTSNLPSSEMEVAGTVTATAFVGDGSGLTGLDQAETDPTVPAGIKDGISWTEISGRPEWLDVGDSDQASLWVKGPGENWVPRESDRQWTSVAMSADGTVQTATADQIYISTDSGNTWIPKGPVKAWVSVAMSSDGSVQIAACRIFKENGMGLGDDEYGGEIHVSNDFGNTWTQINAPFKLWTSVAMSSDGSMLTAVVSEWFNWSEYVFDKVYVSNDFGNTWTQKVENRSWRSVAMSSDGSIQTAVSQNFSSGYSSDFVGEIYVSTDSGNTWTRKGPYANWKSVAMSSDGSVQTAVAANDQIYISTDSGNTWTPKGPFKAWKSVAMSSDGTIQTASAFDQTYLSKDSGETWTPLDSSGSWDSIAMSADGNPQTAVVYGGQIYVSRTGMFYEDNISATRYYGDGSSLSGVVNTETDPTVPAAIKDGISWTEVSGRPSGLDDGDDVGLTSETDPVFSTWDRSSGVLITESQITDLGHFTNSDETDPTVPAAIKDGISWTEVSDRPSGLDDGDDVGITSESDPTVPAGIKDGISWTEVSDRPSGLDDGDDVGITSESDPIFSAWDRNSGVTITESQVTDLDHFTNSDETDPTVPENIKDGIDWTEVSGRPSGLDDGDDVGLTTESDPVFSAWDRNSGVTITESQITDLDHFINSDETDPTVPAGIKDGIDWTEVSGRPSGLDDGDDVGLTSESDPTVPAGIKDGISWTEVSGRPTGLDDGDQVGITSESDPQVGSNTTNYIPRWNGSSLVTGAVYDNGTGDIAVNGQIKPRHYGSHSNGGNYGGDVYQISGGSAPTCNAARRGAMFVAYMSGVNRDGICACLYYPNGGGYANYCFSP